MSTTPNPTPDPLPIAPSHIVMGDDAIMHAAISGVKVYHIKRGGPIRLRDAMAFDDDEKAGLFAGVYSLPAPTDRQMIKCIDTVPPERKYAEELRHHQQDMKILLVLAVVLVVACIVFSACLILPRLV